MKKTFCGYYRPSSQELSELWKDCIFVLDANVLLNLYRYPKEARNDLIKIFKQISERLWVPHQVALEYQENRLGVIAEQMKKYEEVKNVLKDTLKKLRGDLDRLQLKKRHSLIKPDNLLEKVENIFGEFTKELEMHEKEQPDVFDDDKLRDEIDLLLEGKVGSPPKSQDDLNKIYEEGKTRYDEKRPPGYMDRKKSKQNDEEVYLYGGLTFKREYGDLVLWYQIISEAKERKLKNIIFISDDDKEDWWWIVDSKGRKTIGPRPELLEEISVKAKISRFYMYNSERFMEFAKEFFGIQIKKESIDQVRDIAAVEKHALKELSDEEKELLLAASQDGEFYLLSVEQIAGTWIRAGGKDFYDKDDPAYAGKYLDAFEFLCGRGYVAHVGGKFFMLTASGFDKARELAKRVK